MKTFLGHIWTGLRTKVCGLAGRRNGYLFPVVTALTLILISTGKVVADGDPLWAIKVGQLVLAHGWPHVDSFSWTIFGRPFHANEWGFDVLLYLASRFGWYGLVAAVTVPAIACCVTIYKIAVRLNEAWGRILYVLFIALCIGQFLVARPQIYGIFFFSLFLYIILFRWSNAGWSWGVGSVVMLVWANMHGSAPLGIFMYLLAGGLDLLYNRKWEGMAKCICLFLVTLINPYGMNLWWSAIIQVVNPAYTAHISEWQALSFTGLPGLSHGIFFIIMLILAARLWRVPQTMPETFTFISLVCFMIEGMMHIRFLPYFYLLVLMTFLYWLPVPDSRNLLDRVTRGFTRSIIVIMFAVDLLEVFMLPSPSIATNVAAQFPTGGVAYIKQNHLEHVFNDYEWGGYLVYEGIPVFIDGRAVPYVEDGEVFNDFTEASFLEKPFDAVAAKYGIRTVLIHKDSPLAVYLEGRPGWRQVYSDKMCVVFVSEG